MHFADQILPSLATICNIILYLAKTEATVADKSVIAVAITIVFVFAFLVILISPFRFREVTKEPEN